MNSSKISRFVEAFKIFLIRNKYWITGLAFAVWMLFFDEYNFFMQRRLEKQIQDTEEKIKFYEKEIAKLNEEYKQLSKDLNAIERYGREHFFLKKDNEDIFILIEK